MSGVVADPYSLGEPFAEAVAVSQNPRRRFEMSRSIRLIKSSPSSGPRDTNPDASFRSKHSTLRADGGAYDAIILARAGIVRLELEEEITEVLSTEVMLPAPGQGALGIECRSNDTELHEMLQGLHHIPTARAVTAERAFLQALGAGCNTPVAAYAVVEEHEGVERVILWGRCLSQDGTDCIEVCGEDSAGAEEALGQRLAADALNRGFTRLCAAH